MANTLAQDFALFLLMGETTVNTWQRELDWIVENGGMALLDTHPDYMSFDGNNLGIEEYPVGFYKDFLTYVEAQCEGEYWHVLPKEMAHFWSEDVRKINQNKQGITHDFEYCNLDFAFCTPALLQAGRISRLLEMGEQP